MRRAVRGPAARGAASSPGIRTGLGSLRLREPSALQDKTRAFTVKIFPNTDPDPTRHTRPLTHLSPVAEPQTALTHSLRRVAAPLGRARARPHKAPAGAEGGSELQACSKCSKSPVKMPAPSECTTPIAPPIDIA